MDHLLNTLHHPKMGPVLPTVKANPRQTLKIHPSILQRTSSSAAVAVTHTITEDLIITAAPMDTPAVDGVVVGVGVYVAAAELVVVVPVANSEDGLWAATST